MQDVVSQRLRHYCAKMLDSELGPWMQEILANMLGRQDSNLRLADPESANVDLRVATPPEHEDPGLPSSEHSGSSNPTPMRVYLLIGPHTGKIVVGPKLDVLDWLSSHFYMLTINEDGLWSAVSPYWAFGRRPRTYPLPDSCRFA